MAQASGKRLILSLLWVFAWPLLASADDLPAAQLMIREKVIGPGSVEVLSTGTRPFSGFVMPSALAAEGDTLFAADQGLQRIYRIEAGPGELHPLQPLDGQTPRLRSNIARSWFLVPGTGNEILQFGPDGDARGEFSSIEYTQAVDVVRERQSGRIWIFDRGGSMHEFSPLGSLLRSHRILADRGAAIESAIAGRHFAYALDRSCACVIELDSHGLPLRLIADGEVEFARDIAVDEFDRIWVTYDDPTRVELIDTDEKLHVLDLHSVGLNQVTALAVADGRLFVADPTQAAVIAFRLLPPNSQSRH